MLGLFFYSPIIPILCMGLPLVTITWIVKKLIGKEMPEPVAWTVLVLLTVVVVDAGLSLTS